MKKKKIILPIIIVVMAIVIGLGAFFLIRESSGIEDEKKPSLFDQEKNIVVLTPEDIGLELELTNNNREVIIRITKTDNILSFDYEMSYDAIENGEVVSRGTFGSGKIENGEIIERVNVLGTCSSGKCKYDKGIKEINFVIRVDLKSGELGLIEQVLIIE